MPMQDAIVEGVMNVLGPCLGFALAILLMSLSAILIKRIRGGSWKNRERILYLCLSCICAVMVAGVTMNVELPWPKTEYSTEYSRLNFNRVRLGDSSQQVYALLGAPLERREAQPVRRLHYPEKQLTVDEYYHKSVNVRGPENLVRMLRSIAVEDISKKLGEPTSIEPIEGYVLLRYSRPAGEYAHKDYWVRNILLNEDGKVVKKTSSYYWSF